MADTDLVSVGTHTAIGAIAGGVLGSAALVAAGILFPPLGLATLGATGAALVGAIPWLPAGVGAYIGYKQGKKAQAAQ